MVYAHTRAEPEPQHHNKNKDTVVARGGGGKSETKRRRLVSFYPPSPLMVMLPEHTNAKSLHDFTLPRLQWGNQKFVRCMKVADHLSRMTSSTSSISAVQHHRSTQQLAPLLHCSTRLATSPKEDDINAVRENLMLELRMKMDNIKKELLKVDKEDDEEEEERKVGRVAVVSRREEDEAAEIRPWNLKTQRAACQHQLQRTIFR